MIRLGVVELNDKARNNVAECIDTEFIGQGKFIKEFEEKTAEFVGMKYGIAVCNGSMADMISLAALKAKYPFKTEVIVPALTFIAQTNAIIMNGLKPVFVDIGYDLQINVNKVREAINDKTLAIMPVHLLGRQCDIDEMVELGVPILEDCCEGFGIKPKQIGTCSFFPSHTITTGEGGMILTNDKELADLCEKMRNHGRRSNDVLDKFHFDVFGFNGKMSNIAAAIGAGVIDEAQDIIERRKANVELYNQKLGLIWSAESPHCYPYICRDEEDRNNKLKELENNGVEARKLFSCLPTQEKVYEDIEYDGEFLVAEDVGRRGLYVPCHQNLTKDNIEKICQILKNPHLF